MLYKVDSYLLVYHIERDCKIVMYAFQCKCTETARTNERDLFKLEHLR